MNLDGETDYFDPATIDWQQADDAHVYFAAQDGIREAQAELARRDAQVRRSSAV